MSIVLNYPEKCVHCGAPKIKQVNIEKDNKPGILCFKCLQCKKAFKIKIQSTSSENDLYFIWVDKQPCLVQIKTEIPLQSVEHLEELSNQVIEALTSEGAKSIGSFILPVSYLLLNGTQKVLPALQKYGKILSSLSKKEQATYQETITKDIGKQRRDLMSKKIDLENISMATKPITAENLEKGESHVESEEKDEMS